MNTISIAALSDRSSTRFLGVLPRAQDIALNHNCKGNHIIQVKQEEIKNIANFPIFLWSFQQKVVPLWPMNDLSYHIEHLLLTHDCVVVPLFGAFVARESESSRVEQENLFFPPLRTVRFNADVTEDDGLLVGEISHSLRCTIPEAKRNIQAMILRLRQQLLAEGQVDFGSIGVFMQDEDGHLTFSSCQAGVTTPEFYGLDAFFMPYLSTTPAASRKERHRQQIRQMEAEAERDTIIIRLSRRALHHTAVLAAAAVVIACVLFTLPADILRQKQSQLASLFPTEKVNTKPASATSHAASATTAKQKTTTSALTTTNASSSNQDRAGLSSSETLDHQQGTISSQGEQASSAAATSVSPAANYAVVLASSIGRRNAERFIGELHEKGIDAHIYEKGKMLRVLIDGFATESEAYNEAKQIQAMGGELEAAWVMKL